MITFATRAWGKRQRARLAKDFERLGPARALSIDQAKPCRIRIKLSHGEWQNLAPDGRCTFPVNFIAVDGRSSIRRFTVHW